MTTTTAVWFTAPRTAELREEELRAPGAGEILVRSICALVSTGSEMNMYRGEGNLPGIEMIPNSRGTVPFPVSFGYQQVGQVEQAGPGSRFQVGDRVFCIHPHHDAFVVADDFAVRIPDILEPARAAFAGLFTVALNAAVTTPVVVGDCAAVSGLGIIGSFMGALARRTASRLVLIERDAHRRQLAKWIGADLAVSPEEAREAIDELTDGRGVDIFYEVSGAPAALQTAIDNTAVEGTITALSWYGTRPAQLRLSPEFHLRRHKIVSTGPGMPPAIAPRWTRDRMMAVAFDFLAENAADELLITHRVPFGEAPKAFEILDTRLSEAMGVLIEHGG